MKKLLTIFITSLLIGCSSSDSSDNSTEPQDTTSIPTVSISSITNILQNSAVSGGNVTDDGGANVTAKGICWSTTTNPTISDFKTNNGVGMGIFGSNLNNLTKQTTYYVRAYATNSKGTAYSNQITFTTPLCASGVYDGDVTLTTQEEVDDFASYCYTKIDGSLNIESVDPDVGITDLSGLNTLESVKDELYVFGNNQLINLNGLQGLKDVRNIIIETNSNLLSINALSNLEELTGIQNNGWNFGIRIIDNESLTSLDGLEKITVSGTVSIGGNPSLVSIQGLQGLTQIKKDLVISDNDLLSTLDGLNNIETISEELTIAYSPIITSLSPLSNLTDIGGNLLIDHNNALISLEGLEGVSISGGIIIQVNDELASISQLSSVTTLGGNSTVNYNPNLTTLDGLQNLTLVEGSLDINRNDILYDLCALTNLLLNGTIEGGFYIVGNAYNPSETQIANGYCSN